MEADVTAHPHAHDVENVVIGIAKRILDGLCSVSSSEILSSAILFGPVVVAWRDVFFVGKKLPIRCNHMGQTGEAVVTAE